MDIFITIISWIGGIALFGILGLAFGFSAGGFAQTKNSDLGIISLASTVLIFWLLWMGASSLYHMAGSVVDAYTSAPQQSSLAAQTTATRAQQPITTVAVDKNDGKDNLQMQILFILASIPFLIWLLSPSGQEDKEKELIRKKLMATVALEKDESGTRPWDPNWKPKDGHSENDEK